MGERAGLEELQGKGYQAFDVMETHLARNDFFAGNAYSIADIALYAYSHISNYAEFDLAGHGCVRRWQRAAGIFQRSGERPQMWLRPHEMYGAVAEVLQ